MRSFVVNLECTYPGCGEEYSIDELNKLCIKCGKVLYARYDINAAKKSLEDKLYEFPLYEKNFEICSKDLFFNPESFKRLYN